MNTVDKKKITVALTQLYTRRTAQAVTLANTDVIIAKAEAELAKLLAKKA